VSGGEVPATGRSSWMQHMKETVEVIPVGRLRRRLGGQERIWVEPEQTVEKLMASLEIDTRSVVIMVNGHRAAKEYVLRPGDEVKLLPLISGG
jgi:sulfur carrier protein ThiS